MSAFSPLEVWQQLLALIAVEVTLIVGIATLLDRWTKSATWRRTLWQACLIGLATLLVLESSGLARIPVRSASHKTAAGQSQSAEQPTPSVKNDDRLLPLNAAPIDSDSKLANAASRETASSPATGRLTRRPSLGRADTSLPETLTVVIAGAVWLLGAGIMLTRICLARLLFVYLRRLRLPVSDAELLQRVKRLARRVGLRRPVRLFESGGLLGPIAIGVWRPIIGLPARFKESFSPTQQEAMLVHELTHLAEHDTAWNCLATLLTAALWWHPVVWWARRQLQVTSELAADEAILAVDDGPKALAECLMTVGERCLQRQSVGWLGIEGSAYRSALGQRVARLINLTESSWSPANATGLRAAKTFGPAALSLATILVVGWVASPTLQRHQVWRNWEKSFALVASVWALASGLGEPPDASSALSSGLAEGSDPRAAPNLTVRRLHVPDFANPGTVSPDGRYLSYGGQSADRCLIYEFATKSQRTVSEGGGTWGRKLFSRDGRWLAASRWEGKTKQLRVIDLADLSSRVVFESEDLAIWPQEWSPDEEYILTITQRKDKARQIALLSLADGSVRPLKTLDSRWPGGVSFSPDGRFIVYDFPQAEDSEKRDIFAFEIATGRHVTLVRHTADDWALGWAPSGDQLLFRSDRRGTWDLFALEVVAGDPQDEPRLVKAGVGRIFPLGFTHAGAFFYFVQNDSDNIYLARLDPQTHKLQGAPVKAIEHFEGINTAAEWSPDGRLLAYISRRGTLVIEGVLLIRTLETGEERQLAERVSLVRWSPEGRSLLVKARDRNRSALCQIDLATGSKTELLQLEANQSLLQANWWPDGKSIHYSVRVGDAQVAIRRRDLETKQEATLYKGPHSRAHNHDRPHRKSVGAGNPVPRTIRRR